jgi:Holliday junction resolvase-like predicted endonuclease
MIKHPEYTGYTLRFDVISIMIDGKKETIKHIENAF